MNDGTLRIGLRFDRRDRVKLRELAAMVERKEILGDRTTFDQAAEAAEQGVPLEVICTKPEEAIVMASLFRTLGCRAPAVEELYAPR